MAALVCDLCGGKLIMGAGGIATCDSCGMEYTPERMKEKVHEIKGTVKIDKSKELENWWILARRAKESREFALMTKYYTLIAEQEPNNWEAVFYQTYCNVYNEAVESSDGQSAAISMLPMKRIIASIIQLIIRTVEKEKQLSCIEEVSDEYRLCFLLLAKLSRRESSPEKNCHSAMEALVVFADEIEKNYSSDEAVMAIAVKAWKDAIDVMSGLAWGDSREIVARCKEKIKQYAPEQEEQSGCYVATAVYGSYDCPQVWTLRRYRDYILAETWYGRAFIYVYYAVSPTLVKYFGHAAWFKQMWKPLLDNMVNKLNRNGFSDTPYDDIRW